MSDSTNIPFHVRRRQKFPNLIIASVLFSLCLGNTVQAVAQTITNQAVRTSEKYLEIAETALDSGDYQKAIKFFTKSIAINPHNADAYYNRGNIQRKLNNHQEAINDYTKPLL